MSDERKQILNMLAENKITVDEAEKLLQALGEESEKQVATQDEQEPVSDTGKKPKYLYVSVVPKNKGDKKGETVNIKVPLILLRTGLKFGGVLPDSAKEKISRALGDKGIDIGKLNESDFEEMVEGLSKLSINVDDADEIVNIYCK
jgi:Glu-tRNA(Gln) amidotransferase subunit E-like FAD-binding protein